MEPQNSALNSYSSTDPFGHCLRVDTYVVAADYADDWFAPRHHCLLLLPPNSDQSAC